MACPIPNSISDGLQLCQSAAGRGERGSMALWPEGESQHDEPGANRRRKAAPASMDSRWVAWLAGATQAPNDSHWFCGSRRKIAHHASPPPWTVPTPDTVTPVELTAQSSDSFLGTISGTLLSYAVTVQYRTVELGHVATSGHAWMSPSMICAATPGRQPSRAG